MNATGEVRPGGLLAEWHPRLYPGALILASMVILKVVAPIQVATVWFFDVDRHPLGAIGIAGGIWSLIRASFERQPTPSQAGDISAAIARRTVGDSR